MSKKKSKSNFLPLILVGGMLLFSSVFYVVQLFGSPSQQTQVKYYGTWHGFQVYEQELTPNSSIYYLVFQGGQLPLRVPPERAESFPSPPPSEIRNLLFTSSKVVVGFYPSNKSALLLAFPELGRFLANKPFKPIFGVLKPVNTSTTVRVVDPFNVSSNEAGIAIFVGFKNNIEIVNRTILLYCRDSNSCLEGVTKIGLSILGIIQ